MPEPYWTDGMRTLYHGDAWELAGELEPESIDCIVTSPSYWSLRDYGTAQWEGGSEECGHSAGAKRTQAGFNERYFGKPSLESDKQSEVMIPYRDVCGKCGARRIDRQFGLEAHPDCGLGLHGFAQLRDDLTPEEKEFVLSELIKRGLL